jgi:hypothetical protein
MTSITLKFVIEKLDCNNENVINKNEISTIDITTPASILELGLRHDQQIKLLYDIQNIILSEQAALLKKPFEICQRCGSSLWANGYKKSHFHSVFTDHQIEIQRHKCSSNNCKWTSIPSIKSLLGTSIHPDLYNLQCKYGAQYTYRKAEELLAALCSKKREINNHDRIRETTNNVGAVLSEKNKLIEEIQTNHHAAEIIIELNSTRVPIQRDAKKTFKPITATIYQPQSVIKITKDETRSTDKNFAVSAKFDRHFSMQRYLLRAAKLQGLTKNTLVTGIADGTKNCWIIISSLKPYCKSITSILDWHPILRKFERAKKSTSADFSVQLQKIKNLLWNGQGEEALATLAMLENNTLSNRYKIKIRRLYGFLEKNKMHLVNYSERALNGLPYTSQLTELTNELFFNTRHPTNQSQWTQDGIHHMLQIQAALAGNKWDSVWLETVMEALGIKENSDTES